MNKMLRIALVGYGYWGPNVAKNIYKNKNLIFHSICDKREKRIEKAKELYANSILYTDKFEEIIVNPEIDIIALAVETSAHYELAKQALLAGKHLYIEKPFTDNSGQAIELRNIALKKRLKIHIDHIMVYHPAIRKIKEIIDTGELGKIIYFDCSRLNLGNVKNDVSVMWDLCVHDLSIIDYLTDGSKVRFLRALGEKIYSKKESIAFLSIQYDEFLASIQANWISPIKERKIIIGGTKKMLVYDDMDVINKLILYDKGFDITNVNPDLEYDEFVVKSRIGDAIIPKLENEDALYNSIEHFRKSIITNTESLTNADAAIRVIQILESADQELIKNRKVNYNA